MLITLRFHPGEEIWVFERMGSRSCEKGSPKREWLEAKLICTIWIVGLIFFKV